MTIDTAMHKNILFQILKDVYSDTTISSVLGFKGGTAALMFYGLDRFSVDLDFDLLDATKEDYVFQKIENIVKKYGEVVDAHKKRNNVLVVLSYEKMAHHIKVEINRKDFGSRYELRTYLGVSMLVMVREDMFAHKLMAMHERVGKTSRDIYDVWFFAKNNWPINRKIVEERAKTLFKDLVEKAVEQLEHVSDRNILDGVGELLTDRQKDWARAKLRVDTISLLKLMNAEFTHDEKGAIQKIVNEKYLRMTAYVVKYLDIKRDQDYFFKSSRGDNASAYIITLKLENDGKPVELSPDAFTVKAPLDQIAYSIAYHIWGVCDKSQTSQLWKNF